MPAASAAAAATVHLTKKHRKPRRPSMDDASSAGGVSSKSRFSNNMRSNNTGTFYCDKLAKSDEQIRGLLKIKPSHSTFEGSVVFVQRFMRRIREERFRVSAADCIRVGAEVEERRDGLHSLCKYMVFMLLFIAMLALQKSPARALSVESALRDQFENVDQAVNENWIDVSNFEELGDWIVVAIDNLHIANSFQSWGEYDLPQPSGGALPLRGQISSFNNVISGLVLIQKRGTVTDCEPSNNRPVGAYLREYAPFCYTDFPSTTSYGPPPLCTSAEEIAAKVSGSSGSRYINCLENGVDTFTPGNATAHARRYKYSTVSKGFIEIIDLGSFGSTKDQANAKWNELVETNWLDKQSREMVILILTYNANTGLYGIGTVTFTLNIGGVFKRRLAVESLVISNQYKHFEDFVRLAIEVVFFSWSIFSIFWELIEMKNEGCAEYWGGDGSVWNYIDWLASAVLISNLVLWITIVIMTALWTLPTRPLAPNAEATSSVEKVISNFDAVNQVYTLYGATNVVSLLFMIIRLLKSLNYHPKLAIVSNTIGLAAEDLMHFSFVFVAVLSIYSFMGMVIAGRQMVEFSTFDRALINLVMIALGEFGSWEELYLISPVVGSLFFFSYIAVVTVLMMNIILSIVVESFVRASTKSMGATSVFADGALSLMIDLHLLIKASQCKAPICVKEDDEEEVSEAAEAVSSWINSPTARPKGIRACWIKFFDAVWQCPRARHKMLPDTLDTLGDSEFIVNVETPIKFLKTTLQGQGVPTWALSIVIDKFIRPRKSDLTWGDQAPEWWPHTGMRYEPSHIRTLPLPKRKPRKSFIDKIRLQHAAEEAEAEADAASPNAAATKEGDREAHEAEKEMHEEAENSVEKSHETKSNNLMRKLMQMNEKKGGHFVSDSAVKQLVAAHTREELNTVGDGHAGISAAAQLHMEQISKSIDELKLMIAAAAATTFTSPGSIPAAGGVDQADDAPVVVGGGAATSRGSIPAIDTDDAAVIVGGAAVAAAPHPVASPAMATEALHLLSRHFE